MAQKVKNWPAMQGTRVRSLGQKFPWRREWQPIPLLLPGEFHRRGAWQSKVHGVTKGWTQLSYKEQQQEKFNLPVGPTSSDKTVLKNKVF